MIARITSVLIKMLNRSSGTSFVGLIALGICQNFLSYCKGYVKNEIITVTGTNGKTTTAGIISTILEHNSKKVVHNEKGANMLTGIANIMALNLLPFKRVDYFVLECDEAYLTKLYDYLPSDYLLITNLFRDQLDRYGELDFTAGKIQNAIEKNSNLKLILNADDPMVSNLGTDDNEKIYFGFNNIEILAKSSILNAPIETVNCIKCGENLKYIKRFYAQEGHYYCDCGYSHPDCDYLADAQIYEDYSILKILHDNNEYEFHIGLIGLYNAYNALGAIALAMELGYSQLEIQNALNSYQAIFGRAEKLILKGRSTLVQLIKNPTGASEVLKTVDLKSNILIIINDNYADGRDVSWLWDADFEYLKDAENPIVVSGLRANDMAVRLKYAGVKKENIIIIPKIKYALSHLVNSIDLNEKITILPTYTALLKMQNIFKNF